MSVSLTIAGVERIGDLWRKSLKVTNVLTNQMDSCAFILRGTRPVEGGEIVITDSVHGVMFKGIIDKVQTKQRYPERLWTVKGTDYTFALDQTLVVETYEGETAGDILLDILAKYCTGFTGTHVQSGSPTIEKIVFEYKRPSECFKELAKYIGWSWFVDPDKDVWFFSSKDLGTEAPEDITISSFVRDFSVDFDRGGLANRVYVLGGSMLSDIQTLEWKADGVARTWALPWVPSEAYLMVNAVPVSPDGAVGIEKVDDESSFDYMLNTEDKYLRASAGTGTIPDGTTITLQGKQNIPVISMLDDMDSQASIQAIEGGSGIYEEVIDDESLITIEAASAAAAAYLADHANPVITGSFISLTPGWMPGQLVTINLPDDGLNNQYVVEETTNILVDGFWEWGVTFGGRLIGIPDVLKALVSAQQQRAHQQNAVVNKIRSNVDAVTASDSTTTTLNSDDYVFDGDDALFDFAVFG